MNNYNFLEEITCAAQSLSQGNNEIENALFDVLNIANRDYEELNNRELSCRQIFDLLENYDFPTHEDLRNSSELLTEQTIKRKGIWRKHNSDVDTNFPSHPHAHDIENGEKLHLGTGDVYDHNKKLRRILKPETLIEIREGLGIKENDPPELSDKCKRYLILHSEQ